MNYNTSDNTWRFSLGRKIAAPTGTPHSAGSTISLTEPDGSVIVFNYDTILNAYVTKGLKNGDQILRPRPTNSNEWELTHTQSGVREIFLNGAQGGMQMASMDLSGRMILFNYDQENNIYEIQAGASTISIERRTQVNQISISLQATSDDSFQTLMQYQLDELGRITDCNIPLGTPQTPSDAVYNCHYGYDTNGNLNSLTQTDGTSVTLGYQNGKIFTVTDGENRQYQLNYSANQTTLTDPLQNVTTIQQSANQLTIQKPTQTANVIESTQYTFNNDGHLASIRYPQGTTENFTYNTLGLLATKVDGLSHALTLHHDSLGNVTSSTRFLTETNPSIALTTFFIYNALRQLVYEISPEGCVTAYTYQNGNRISSRVYLDSAFDLRTATPTTQFKQSDLQPWCANQNKQNTTLTEFGYDASGQCNSQKKYANLNSDHLISRILQCSQLIN